MTNAFFKLSPKFIDVVLNNTFGTPVENYQHTDIYVGLGIEFDEYTFSFTKEPVSRYFTVTEYPCIFSEPVNGIIRNTSAIEWDKATVNWTEGTDTIKYIGLYYRTETGAGGNSGSGSGGSGESGSFNSESTNASGSGSNLSDSDIEVEYEYELICVLPIIPEETVLIGERMVLNPNSIQLRLSNK